MLKDIISLFKEGHSADSLFVLYANSAEERTLLNIVSGAEMEGRIHGINVSAFSTHTVEGSAQRVAEIMVARDPNGPYRVIGWEDAAIVAYETSVQLIGRDREIAFLALVNTTIRKLVGGYPGRGDLDGRSGQLNGAEGSQCGTWPFLSDRMPDGINTEHTRRPGALPNLEQRSKQHSRNRAHSRLDWYMPQPIPIEVHVFLDEPRRFPHYFPFLCSLVSSTNIRIHRAEEGENLLDGLCRELSRAMEGSKSRATEGYSKIYSPLVRLHKGQDEVQAPLICIPGAGDNVTAFLELSNHIGGSRAVYGLQPRGVDGEFLPHTTVEVAVECYFRAVEPICAGGAVNLVGHSFGGWVAFELALMLIRAGHRVGDLILLDSDGPKTNGESPQEYSRVEAIMAFVDVMEQSVKHSLYLSREQFENQIESEQLRLLHTSLSKEGLVPRRSTPDLLRGPLSTFSAAIRTHYQCMTEYFEEVQLFLAMDERLSEIQNQTRHAASIARWKRLIPRLKHIVAQGNHLTMLNEPNVQILAGQIRLCERR
jgi:thioesterase domain-containing protein